MTSKERKEVEDLVYQIMDILDPKGYNTSYYKARLSKLTDSQFIKFFRRNLPIRYQLKNFVNEPTMDQIEDALKVLGVPLLEKIALPYLYVNKQGEPVTTHEAMVIYIHLKKMKQFLTKKNSMASNIDNRDMKTGLLMSHDKGGKESDREMEGLCVMGLDHTMKELSTWRADYMDAKSIGYQTISTLGDVSEDDVPINEEDSLSKNMFSYYMLGAGLMTNIINREYQLPITINNKKRNIQRV